MPLDPQAQMVVDAMNSIDRPPTEHLTPLEHRDFVNAAPKAPGPEVAVVEDRLIPGPLGQITVRVYKPHGSGPFPILMYFHGGGWVVGSLDGSWDGTVRRLVDQAGCVAVSVDYALAPEHKFPAPVEDCYAATKWVADNAKVLDGDASRIALAGDSAGGNLVAAVALMARDRNGPNLVGQVMAYGVFDRDFETESYTQMAEGPVLTKAAMRWYWEHYLNDDSDASNSYAAPLQATDLSNLPPAFVITADYDVLRDEGLAYAGKLAKFGIPVVCENYEGMIHGFLTMAHVLDKGKEVVARVATMLKESFYI